jgi:hypothetical protein
MKYWVVGVSVWGVRVEEREVVKLEVGEKG